MALDHTGSSDTRARMWLVLRLLEALPASRWKGLVADREFIGAEWFRFLRRKGVRRAVRIRKNTVLDGLPADEWFHDLQHSQFRIIATDFHVWETWKLYKLRWTIKSNFNSQKSRGLDLERTGVTDPTRLERLFGLVTLAWLTCLRVGIWRHKTTPIRMLAHGRKAMSLVRYGSEELRHMLRWVPERLGEILRVLIRPFFTLGQPETEVFSY